MAFRFLADILDIIDYYILLSPLRKGANILFIKQNIGFFSFCNFVG